MCINKISIISPVLKTAIEMSDKIFRKGLRNENPVGRWGFIILGDQSNKIAHSI